MAEEYEQALRVTSKINIKTSGPPQPLILYRGPFVNIKYTVCPHSDVASRSRTPYTIDIKHLHDVHGDKWFEHLLYQAGWRFGNPSTHDMTFHAAGGHCNGTLCAHDIEIASAETLKKYVFHIHFAKRSAPSPEPVQPYEFDVEEEDLWPLPPPVVRRVSAERAPAAPGRVEGEVEERRNASPAWVPSCGKPYPYPGDLQ